jgi:hypothetical protein
MKTPDTSVINKEAKVPVKDSWYKAYVEANIRMPQIMTGIEIFLADALFNDQEIDFMVFTKSEFSQSQKKDIGRVMSIMHAKYEVAHTAPEHSYRFKPGTHLQKVPDERLETIWTRPRDIVVANLFDVFRRDVVAQPNFLNASSREEALNRFLNDPRHAEKIAEFKIVIGALKRAMTSVELKQPLNEYIKHVKMSDDERGYYLNIVRGKIFNIACAELEKAGVDMENAKDIMRYFGINKR